MSGFDTEQTRIDCNSAGELWLRSRVLAACDEIDRLRVTLTATENALRKVDGRIEFAIECLRSDIDSACRPDTAIEALTHSLTIAREAVSA